MSDLEPRPDIRLDRIPVGKGFAALVVIVVLIATMLIELPSLRLPVVLGASGGVLFAVLLILWHRYRR